MEDVASLISQIFGWSLGVSAIVAVAISALWAIYFNRIKEGQRAEFQKQIEVQKAEFSKQLESIKAKNEKMNYITKTQFDAEFRMYQELSEACIETFISVNNIFPIKEKIDTEQFMITASKNTLIYSRRTYKYAPFLKKELFEKFQKLSKIFCDVLSLARFENKYLINIEELKELRANMHEIQADIYNELREYLQSLKVQED